MKLKKIKETWREFSEKIRTLEEKPEKIARAAAIGALLGSSPTFGFAVLLVYPVAKFFKLNVWVAYTVKFMVSNPWTTPFIWVGQFWLGFWALGLPFPSQLPHVSLHELSFVFWVYVLGATIFGVLAGLTIYCSVYVLLKLQSAKKGRAS